MRLIDADKLDWWYKGRNIRRVIDEAPTIDAVPVCRCKDCKHYNTIDWDGNVLCGCNLKSGMVDITPDGFCSYGERKDGAG